MTDDQSKVPSSLLEPHDPLLMRDGRSFGSGESARSLPFVPPTTLIGLIRTLHGSRSGHFDPDLIGEVLGLSLRGPLLARLPDGDGDAALYAPAPRDAVMLGEDEAVPLHRLRPASPAQGVLLDNDAEELWPLVLPGNPKGKPGTMPQFWPWTEFGAWLLGQTVSLNKQGVRLDQSERTHVSLNAATGTAADGLLFGTSALEFLGKAGQRFGLSFHTDADLPAGAVPFGGERRLSVLHPAQGPRWPACPDQIRDEVMKTGRVRVILMTPAVFEHGWKPTWLLSDPDVQPRVRAAAVGRPVTLSGWDLQKGAPKPSRRLAPEGSVYHLELGGSPEQRGVWAENLWLKSVSDGEQDRRDGLGLAVLGVWRDE